MSALERATALDAFIQAFDWEDATRFPLQADASFRRYIRLKKADESVMVMDAPPPQEDVRPFVKIAKHLKAHGFSAPEILAEDINAGFLILEDFGDDTFTNLLASGESEEKLYKAAITALAEMHQDASFGNVDAPAYDADVLMEEANLLIDWYFPEVMGNAISDPARTSYEAAWREVFATETDLPKTLVLRDFHVDNLMLLPEREGAANCGLLDFQDALTGSPAYDVTSLLEDARRDIDPAFRNKMLDHYFSLLGGVDKEAFEKSCAILSAQRHAKIVGIFTRLYRRDDKAVYLKHIPRVLGYLNLHLKNPVLAPVVRWFENEFPNYLDLPETLKG